MRTKVLLKKCVGVFLIMSLLVTALIPGSFVAAAKTPKLNSSSKVINKGKGFNFNIKNKIKGSKYTWTSSNAKIAKVNKRGIVTGVKAGKATITCAVEAPKSTYKLKAKVTIKNVPTSISISNEIITLEVGKTHAFKETVKPKNSNYTLTWKSSDESVAQVNKKGKITALKEGNVVITVTTDNKKKASVKLKVVEREEVTEPTTQEPTTENNTSDAGVLPPMGGSSQSTTEVTEATTEETKPTEATAERIISFSEDEETWEEEIALEDNATTIKPVLKNIVGVEVELAKNVEGSSGSSSGVLMVKSDSNTGERSGISYSFFNDYESPQIDQRVAVQSFRTRSIGLDSLMQPFSIQGVSQTEYREYTLSAKLKTQEGIFKIKLLSEALGTLVEKEINSTDWTEVKATVKVEVGKKDKITFALGKIFNNLSYYIDDIKITSKISESTVVEYDENYIFAMTMKADGEYYKIAGMTEADEGEWKKIEGSIVIPEGAEEISVYVEMPNDSKSDFSIDDFSVSLDGVNKLSEGFENGKSSFFATGLCKSTLMETTDDASAKSGNLYFQTINRRESWEGPMVILPNDLETGKEYTFTIWVRNDGTPDKEPSELFSMKLLLNGEYIDVNTKEVNVGSWTKFEGIVNMPGKIDSAFAYVEVLSNPTVEFYVDDFAIVSGNTNLIIEGFEEESTSFYGMGTAGAEITAGTDIIQAKNGNNHYKVFGRSETWQGAGMDITSLISPENKYRFSIWVATGEEIKSPEDFKLTVRVSEDYEDPESFIEIQSADSIEEGVWTKIEGKITIPDRATDVAVYVERPNDGSTDFSIDDFIIMQGDTTILNEDFEKGMHAFYGMGGCGVNLVWDEPELVGKQGSTYLKTKNRTQDWEGPMISVDHLVTKGEEYTFSVMVKYGEPKKELDRFSMEFKFNGESAWLVSSQDSERGVWTNYTRTITIPQNTTTAAIYIQGPEDTSKEFLLDEFLLMTKSGKEVFREGFEGMTTGFYGFGARAGIDGGIYNKSIKGSKYLWVTDRINHWDGAGILLNDLLLNGDIKAGEEYIISVWVKSGNLPKQENTLSMNLKSLVSGEYRNQKIGIVNNTQKGSWVKLEGLCDIPIGTSIAQVCIEMPNNANAEFSIDSFSMLDKNNESISILDFEIDWLFFYGTGNSTASIVSATDIKPAHEGNQYLRITNRTQTWEGAERIINDDIIPGETYKFIIWVRID